MNVAAPEVIVPPAQIVVKPADVVVNFPERPPMQKNVKATRDANGRLKLDSVVITEEPVGGKK